MEYGDRFRFDPHYSKTGYKGGYPSYPLETMASRCLMNRAPNATLTGFAEAPVVELN